MGWFQYALIILAGFFSGFINTLAGSGSLVTLPLLIALGLPANVANGTNRIAIFLQSLVGVASFKRQKVLEFKSSVNLVIPAVIGSVIGAFLAVDINEKIMTKAIAGLLIFMFFFILLKPSKWLKEQQITTHLPYWARAIIFFVIGLYGGFIQAGVGFFLLAGLVLGAGYDLVRANAVKIFIVLIYTGFAIVVFLINDQINFKYGLILAAGSMLGAYVGARFAVKWGPKFVRYLLLVTLVVAAVHMLGIVG